MSHFRPGPRPLQIKDGNSDQPCLFDSFLPVSNVHSPSSGIEICRTERASRWHFDKTWEPGS